MSLVPDYDVLIIGGGLAGSALGLALTRSQLRVALVEARAPDVSGLAQDDRALTLAHSSRHLFEKLGLWAAISRDCHPTAITEIHVSGGHRSVGATHILASDLDVEALGYVVGYGALAQLVTGAAQRGLETIAPARLQALHPVSQDHLQVDLDIGGAVRSVTTRLLVGSDGTQSTVRRLAGISAEEQDYVRDALVLRVAPGYPLEGRAFERFTESGPIALVPRADQATLIVTLERPEVEAYLQQPEALCALAVRQLSGRGGALEPLGAAHRFPLRFLRADSLVANRVALIGNAAHTLHPVAGQGLNLGLRDVDVLSEILAGGVADPGAEHVLASFDALRRRDIAFTATFTHGLVQWFGASLPDRLRGLALLAIDVLPGAKRALARRTMGWSPLLENGAR